MSPYSSQEQQYLSYVQLSLSLISDASINSLFCRKKAKAISNLHLKIVEGVVLDFLFLHSGYLFMITFRKHSVVQSSLSVHLA